MTYLYPLRRGVGWKSQGFRTNPNSGANGPGGHTGDDWAVPVGTPLYAPGDGIIRNSGWLSDNYRDNGWWLTRMGGDTLVIDIVDSFRRSESLPTFILAHCSDTMAEVGEFVRKAQLVALSGNTGTATTGPHVHIEALPPNWDFGNGVYGRVAPETYFDEYLGGLAAQGTITPLEDIMAKLDDEDREWIGNKFYEVLQDPVVLEKQRQGIINEQTLINIQGTVVPLMNSHAQALWDGITAIPGLVVPPDVTESFAKLKAQIENITINVTVEGK